MSPKQKTAKPAAGPQNHAAKRLVYCLLPGIAAGVGASFFCAWATTALIGWDTTAGLILFTIWLRVHGMTPDQTKERAKREDPSVAASDVLVLGASVACLVGVAFEMLKAAKSTGGEEAFLIGIGVLSVIISWTLVHALFTLRYGRLYYGGQKGGIDFNDDDNEPNYLDFAYVAFTIGMTFQVSDTELKSREIRRAALHQALLSYLFGAVIVAMTINIVGGLFK